MNRESYVLGIDTSNYKTSVCILNSDEIVCDVRRFLEVKEGERGLRQSDALFQHVKNLPGLIDEAYSLFDGEIHAVAFSSKPRPVEDSYMPVFLAGESIAKAIAASIGVPAFGFSHQEGHIQAIKSYTEMSEMDEFLACHFSGGTCEVLRVRTLKSFEEMAREAENFHEDFGYKCFDRCGEVYDIEIVGGSKDISYGQVLDRAGVEMGFSFPAGKALDEIAMSKGRTSSMLTPIRAADGYVNLSGIDTQIKSKLRKLSSTGGAFTADTQIRDELIREIFCRISDSIADMLKQASIKTGLKDVIMSGGVTSSEYVRRAICDPLEKDDIIVYFDEDENDLSTDNAVGTALLGGMCIWDDPL